MTNGSSDPIAVEFTPDEARLIVAALRQFEPFWPSDMDDMSRAELLAGIHQGIEHVVEALDDPRTSAS
jgi:predicted DNA-binding transcriptional regulator YafY